MSNELKKTFKFSLSNLFYKFICFPMVHVYYFLNSKKSFENATFLQYSNLDDELVFIFLQKRNGEINSCTLTREVTFILNIRFSFQN